MGRSDGETESVSVFVPRGLDDRVRAWSKKEHVPLSLYGWYLPGTLRNTTHTFVIAGASPREQLRAHSLERCDESGGGSNVAIIGSIQPSRTQNGVDTHPGQEAKERQDATTSPLEFAEYYLPSTGSATKVHYSFIRFDIPRPNKMRYLSIEPMVLPLSDDVEKNRRGAEDDTGKLQQERLEKLVLLDPLRYSDLCHEYPSGRAPGDAFRQAIECINQVAYVQGKMDARQSSQAALKGNYKKTQQQQSLDAHVWMLSAIRKFLHFSVRGMSLNDISACSQQLNLRLAQLSVWPMLTRRLRHMRVVDNEPISEIAPRYTALYNGIWLVANDLILGQAIGVLLCENRDLVGRTTQSFIDNILVTHVIQTVRWLDSWPLGVKLNTPLSRLFADMYVGMTEFWSAYGLTMVTGQAGEAIISRMVYVAGILTRIFGVSMLLCLIVDVARLMTIHLTIFYHIQRWVYAFFCSSTISLFHLFRGKKRNRLRGMRVDNATYELDQLLLGTLFFTLLIFLWLTVATYYAYFAALRFVCVAVLALLQAATATINHLPLFALMLRLKDPARLPGGVAIEVDWQSYERDRNRSVPLQRRSLRSCLINTPLSLNQIFRGQSRHLEGLRSLPRLFVDVILGQSI